MNPSKTPTTAGLPFIASPPSLADMLNPKVPKAPPARKLWYIPIEPFPGRYTQSWYDNFPEYFQRYFGRDNVVVVDGIPLSNTIEVGTFLDINSTIHYKNSQMMFLAKMFRDGKVGKEDVFFFADAEFWGLESLRLMADMNGLPGVAMAGFWHAASYTTGDAFAIAEPYQKFTEQGWLNALDLSFYGSEYHRDKAWLLRSEHNSAELMNRTRVTGNPIFSEDYPYFLTPKENIVVFPNRFDSEKGAQASVGLALLLSGALDNWRNSDGLREPPRIVFTTSHAKLRGNDPQALNQLRGLQQEGKVEILEGLSKRDYHNLLARAKVMVTCSREENYGYCIAESILYGCVPVMPQCASHPEFLSPAKFPDSFYSFDQDATTFPVDTITEQILSIMKNPTVMLSPKSSPLLVKSFTAADSIARQLFNFKRNA